MQQMVRFPPKFVIPVIDTREQKPTGTEAATEGANVGASGESANIAVLSAVGLVRLFELPLPQATTSDASSNGVAASIPYFIDVLLN